MHPLLHSPFLQALGYAIFNSLWQFALLWLLYFAINTIFKLSSHQKYTTGLLLEFAGFIWFLETLRFYYNQSLLFAQDTLHDHLANFQTVGNSSNTIKEKVFLAVLRSEHFFPYLSIAYLALLFVLLIKWMYAYTYTQKVRTEGLQSIDGSWQVFVDNLSAQLVIKRAVTIFLSELVQTPLTIGFVKPLILIPVATINYLTPQQMEAVILHELAHIKRFDYLFNLLLALIEACLFFNPFTQLIQQQIKKERENCCDDWVIKYEYCATSYAQALLQIASHQTSLPLFALKATDNKKLLINRIKRIIEKNERSFFNYKHQLLALLMMTTVLSSLSFLSPAKKIANRPNRGFQRNIIIEPIAANVSNPLFNPVFFLTNSSKIEAEQKRKSEPTKSVKINIRENRLSGPSEPPPPSEADAFVENENDNLIEQTSGRSSVYVIPVTAGNKAIAISKNSLKDLEKHQYQLASTRIVERFSIRPETMQTHFKSFYEDRTKESKVKLEKVADQLKKALQEIKAIREHGELHQLQALVRTGVRKIEKERNKGTIADPGFTADQLELLEKQIQKAIDSMQLPKLFSTAFNSDLNINFPIPAVAYTHPPEEEQHAFSYEYFKAPQVKVLYAPTINNCGNAKKKKEKAVVVDEDEIKQEEITPPPPPQSRHRAVFVIKI